MSSIRLIGDETQEQMLTVLKQKGEAQRKGWEHGLLAMACAMVLVIVGKDVYFHGRDSGTWFWCLFGVVIDLPLLYFVGRSAGHFLGFSGPTSFDREVIDLLIVREEDTMAIWKAVYSSLCKSSHLVFREYVVRELSAGRALVGSDEEIGVLFFWELVAARRKAEMPEGYLRLIADYLRRHGKEVRLNEILRDYFPPRSDDLVGCTVRAAVLSEENGSVKPGAE